MTSADGKKTLHLVGVGVTHSIAPPMHNAIAKSLDLDWTFYSTECKTLDDLMELARKPTTAGLVVTMPYKNTIMPRLDRVDELAKTIGAVNNVYRDPSDPTKLVGTNTDWLGIKGCLLEAGDEAARPTATSNGAPALLIGAGGASRAAIYALSAHLHSPIIYVLNRDDGEVASLIRDTRQITPQPNIVHIKSVEQAKDLDSPFYIVSCVPDFPPKSEAELVVAAVLEHFLSRPKKGVLHDMCFKPRQTRILKLGEKHGWPVVEGTHVIGYQIQRQWEVWAGAGKEKSVKLDSDAAWKVLLQAAEASTAINF